MSAAGENQPGTNVISALARVQAEIGGIGKTKPQGAQLAYAYRGIDAISSEAQPLFGREGIVIVPTLATITGVAEIIVNAKPWTDTSITVDWTIYGPGGVSDFITSKTHGLGRDNSDKGINKAMTGAFKNLLLRILCIGDPQDDADQPQHQNNATDQRPVPPVVPDSPEVAEAKMLIDRVRALTVDQRVEYSAWKSHESARVVLDDLVNDAPWRMALGEALDRFAGPIPSNERETTS